MTVAPEKLGQQACAARRQADEVWERKRQERNAASSAGLTAEEQPDPWWLLPALMVNRCHHAAVNCAKLLGLFTDNAGRHGWARLFAIYLGFCEHFLVSVTLLSISSLTHGCAQTELTPMAGAKNKANMNVLLRQPLPLSNHAATIGNEDCWDEEFTYRRCCDLTKGVSGDRSCWRSAEFGYNDCCDVDDRARKARFLMAEGERYFNSARWLYLSSARKRHFKDALAVSMFWQPF